MYRDTRSKSNHPFQEVTMLRSLSLLVIALLFFHDGSARAQDEKSLTRDEVSVIKKKLVAVFEALGQPAGYSVERDDFNLPTEAYKNSNSGKYNLINSSASRRFGTQKKTDEENKDLQKEYQKKVAEAQAKGDYAAMSKLALEMQQKAGAMQLKASETHKDPIEVYVHLNSNPGAVIDPDAVVFEHPGVIALKSNVENGAERIAIYFDPVSLRETKQLSRVDLKTPEDGVARRTLVLNATVDITGPIAEIEPWAKKVDVKKVLSQIDAGK
jgi:hypothetical protein